MTIRDMLISLCLKTSLIVLKILGLGRKHPTELVVLFLDKVMKSGILRSNINSKGHLLLLDGPNGGLDFFKVSGGRSVGRTRVSKVSRGRRRYMMDNLRITRYLMKVSPIK